MHKSAIPADIVEQIKQKRGGRWNRYDSFAAERTALVVVDLQNFFMLPGAPVEVPMAREIVPTVNRLTKAVRAAGGKVVWVKMSLENQEKEWSVFFDSNTGKGFSAQISPGSHGYELYAELEPDEEDLVVEKKRYSAFIQGSSDIDARLRALGIDTVAIVGTLTNVCCESSARDAMMLNYKIAFISDANAAITDTEHNGALTSIARVFGDVLTADEFIARLTPAGREAGQLNAAE